MPMTDEITNEMLGLVFKANEVTSPMLKSAMRDVLNGVTSPVRKLAYKNVRKNKASKDANAEDTELKGNIEITRDNIGDFEHTARKYGIKYTMKEMDDSEGGNNRILVVFKAKNRKTMRKAFAEYAGYALDKDGHEIKKDTRTVDEKLRDAKDKAQERAGKNRERTRSQDRSTTIR